jgi:hypothetical protein
MRGHRSGPVVWIALGLLMAAAQSSAANSARDAMSFYKEDDEGK